ncbi:CRISPR-associated endonuclease Cas3'' (plasmid) [Haloferax mediterranei ATCC 33500]|uniref:CRISPR-associated Cas3 family protein n=1 Tax=Haloferax mediterranei (strain ATCC 33500 / DSM 1411 / JCM 8866 / NBRC 14739 / NCIMB 2177 / R-4) TaxID=523841 RepID=I3RB30_HALMT|nr:CRISPR-associated endonuclease Cas3'' [Haloferax mediterranei]AFK21440.1 CRISPR-associated Cas3 family protein [Haloferax mediterranei ATCC 33500]ELZ97243.1 CRISPR-associated Cas3 family protein [Haloferax mediterranei ATCC 33500]MDX5990021.1 CRISPR-associated endonuclease Cas3'' [Haloferax mediterranei ATCC 33500]QCQ76889.1 CRISPR-associated endonuclease Cas3'' [Haloferax mediterranei ATCC 33500]
MTAEYERRYSHPAEDGRPAVLLFEHLRDVRDRVDMVIPEGATTPEGKPLCGVIRRLALVHDFGKATTFFQQYIGAQLGQPTHDKLRYHAPLGSLAAYYVLRETGHSTATCLAGFVAVAKHHGRLPNVVEYVFKRMASPDPEKWMADKKQVENIHKNAPRLATAIFEEATGDDDAWLDFAQSCVNDESLFTEIADHVTRNGERPITEPTFLTDEFYGLMLECWGTLVLADKTSAAGAPQASSVYDATNPRTADLTQYIDNLGDGNTDPDGSRTEQLNYYRSRARQDVLDSVTEFVESESDVATITLPTGMGKTLTGLNAALEIRDQTGGDRIVYALPFTSIIDQVGAEVQDIFDTDGSDGIVALHHHLSDTRFGYSDGDDDASDLNDDIAGMLGESWRAGLTVTTFVQLFESLAGPRNTQSMKIPALRGNVIVLDEPQSLPLDWWKLVPRLVDVLTEQYGATVISMTATQPELFPAPMSLVSDAERYFTVAERVQYHLHDSVERFLRGEEQPLEYNDAANELVEVAQSGDSLLAICNTIDSARVLANAVTERIQAVNLAEQYFESLRNGSSDPVAETVQLVRQSSKQAFVHLSTRLRPTDRLALIRIIKQLRASGSPVIAVTTQLVEAGVDISFENVYRDLAPVDSIVQAAGRCNRSFERELGAVTVWWLTQPAEQRHTPAVAVYDTQGPSLTPVTASALDSVRDGQTKLAGQSVARAAVQEYYGTLHKEKNVGREEYHEYVDDADAESLGRLSLITQTKTVDVLICVTEADQTLVESLEGAYENYDFQEVKRLLNATKPLRVSIPIYRDDSPEANVVTELRPLAGRKDESSIRVLDAGTRDFEKYFDHTTGFVVADSTVEDRFL